MSEKILLVFSLYLFYHSVMNTITISKKQTQKKDLVTISRKEYETLLKLKETKEFHPTVAQKKALLQAEKNFHQGKTLAYNELIKKLGFTH